MDKDYLESWLGLQPCDAKDSNGTLCEKPADHIDGHACPKALKKYLEYRFPTTKKGI